MKKNKLVLLIAGIVALCIISFVGGTFYGKSVVTPNKGMFAQREGFGMQNGNSFGQKNINGQIISGEIIQKQEDNITIKLKDGGSKIIRLSDQTPILKNASGTLSDINIGEQISITGKSNDDGSINAESIQIRPSMPNIQK